MKKNLFVIISATLLILFNFEVFAEIRMHQYILIKNISSDKLGSANFHHTSLNHLTLNKKFGQLYDKTKVELLRSWMCPGNSSQRKVCRPKSFFKF